MRNMLALFAAGILTVAGLGWYLGWYKVRSQPASVPGQHSVQIDFDTHKIGTDLQKGEQKIQQIIDNKAKEEAHKVPDAKKATDKLMLPSPPPPPQLSVQMENGSSVKVNSGDKGPLLQFHSDKGPSFEIGGDKGASIQFGTEKK